MKKQQEHVEHLVDTSELYEHLVTEHGWEPRPYLINQRLHDLHRLEHTEAELGLVSLTHDHDNTLAPVVPLPWVDRGAFAANSPHAA